MPPPDDHHSPCPDQSWDGIERRSPERLWRDQINARLAHGDAVMRKLQDDLANNTQATARVEAKTEQVAADTSELVELMHSVKGAFVVLNGLGKLAKPITAILALGTSLIVMWQNIRGAR